MSDRLTTNNKGHTGWSQHSLWSGHLGSFCIDKLEIISIFVILKLCLLNHFSPFDTIHVLV